MTADKIKIGTRYECSFYGIPITGICASVHAGMGTQFAVIESEQHEGRGFTMRLSEVVRELPALQIVAAQPHTQGKS